MASKRPTPIPRAQRASGVPLWLKIVGGLVAVVVASHFYLLRQINQFGDGLVETASLFANASHRGGYYTWDGNLGIRKLRIESSTGGTSALKIAELELDTPGWLWVLQLMNPIESRSSRLVSSFSGLGDRDASALPAADSLHLRMRGFELDINDLLPPGLPDVGFTTGVPFETEGCSNVRYFVPLQLQKDLGLPYKQTDISFGFAATGSDQVLVSMKIEAAGLISSSFEVDLTTEQPRRFLESDDGKVKAMRWIISDQGFNEARNRWCAEQAGVDADEFQRRHITTARRILEIYGIRLAPETEAVYSAFAGGGGTLTMEARWPSELTAELYAQYPAEQKWQVLNAQIWRDDSAKVPMQLEFIPQRPLPRAFSGSVYDLLARNADHAAAGQESPLSGLGERMRAMTTPPAEVAAPVAAAKPEAAPKPAPPPRALPTSIALDTPSLVAAIGETVAIETTEGRSRIGRLIAVDPKTLTIEQRVSGGKATLDFSREQVRAVIANPGAGH